MEFQGGSVEKAAEAASKKLKIPREELKYAVISYGSTGLFGLVRSKKAKIRILPPVAETGPDGGETSRSKKGAGDTAVSRQKDDRKNRRSSAVPMATGARGSEALAEEPKALGMSVLKRITELFSEDTKISVEEAEESLLYKIESSDAAVMIGKRGMTLEAIQYITEKIVNKHNSKRVRIQVDIEGYLEKRKSSLLALATRMADKVERTGKPVTIGQMSAYERRIIHIALKEDARVRTQSRGDGYLRKLLIVPGRNAPRRDDS
jgi:spoIIIJ-associated protein